MADALCREYHLGKLPTELLGLNLAPATAILVNARILSYRNEQAKISSIAEGQAAPSKPSVGDKIKAKRMQIAAQRSKALREYGM